MSGDSCNFTRTEWAQRSDSLFITFCVEDCKNPEVKFESNKIIFHGEGGTPKQMHNSELELFKEIDPERSTWTQTQRSILCKVYKKVDEPYWPRLLSAKVKQHWLKIDFNRYKDEDDSDEEDMAGMDMGMGGGQPDLSEMMAQMGRGSGTTLDDLEGDEDSDDSDDEEVPDLETAPTEAENTGTGKMENPVQNGGAGESAEPQACDA